MCFCSNESNNNNNLGFCIHIDHVKHCSFYNMFEICIYYKWVFCMCNLIIFVYDQLRQTVAVTTPADNQLFFKKCVSNKKSRRKKNEIIKENN